MAYKREKKITYKSWKQYWTVKKSEKALKLQQKKNRYQTLQSTNQWNQNVNPNQWKQNGKTNQWNQNRNTNSSKNPIYDETKNLRDGRDEYGKREMYLPQNTTRVRT